LQNNLIEISENFSLGSFPFFPAEKGRKSSEKSENFPVKILPSCSIDIRNLPAKSDDFPVSLSVLENLLVSRGQKYRPENW
jgi:hypothetical protein